MKRFFLRAVVFAVAVLGGPVAVAANDQTPPAGEPGQKTYVFRSLEDPTVPSRPNIKGARHDISHDVRKYIVPGPNGTTLTRPPHFPPAIREVVHVTHPVVSYVTRAGSFVA